MEISRLYINIYVTMNARVVWLFSFVHFHEPGAPPPKRAPWYLQCAAWLETSSRRASLDCLSKSTARIAPGMCTEKNIWFCKCQRKKWRIENTQPLNNLCKSCSYRFKFPLETSKLPTTFFLIFRSKVRFHGTTEHCHGPPDHRDKVLLWFCSDMSHVWVLVSLSRWGKKLYSHATAGVIIPQSCQESGLAACFMLFRKVATFLIAGNDISPISNNQRMVLQETIQTKCTTHTLSVISKTI